MGNIINLILLNNISKIILRFLLLIFFVNMKINFILILILFIQNTVTKNNLLNIYSSGLFSTYDEVNEMVSNLTKLLITYFLLTKIELLFT